MAINLFGRPLVGGLAGQVINRFAQNLNPNQYRPQSYPQPSPKPQASPTPLPGPYIPNFQLVRTARAQEPQVLGTKQETFGDVLNTVKPYQQQVVPSGGGQVQQQVSQQTSAPQSQQDTSYQLPGAVQEQTPQPPQIDFDALIQPALDALTQAESATQATGEADIQSIESGATTQKGNIGALRTGAERQLASRQAATTSAGEQAINESRRAAAEIQQGLASRYGASSSTGLGASAIVGAQSARNISQQRAQLTAALNEVENAKTGIIETYNNALKEVDNTTATLKAQARSTLQTNLSQIGQARVGLQSRKAELVYNAMEQYRQEVNAVNQRNTAFKQTLYTQQQDANNKLAQIEAAAKNKIQSISQPDFKVITNPVTGEVIQTFNPATGGVGTPTGISTTPEEKPKVGVEQLTPEDQEILNKIKRGV